MLPVHILTGFLGSGKTTLLQKLLQDEKLSNSAILVNEFGEIAIDHLILENVSQNTVLLNNGCICCGILSSLSDALLDLLSKRDRGELAKFERIIIETTGLAEPAPILSTLNASRVVKQHVRKASVMTVIDLSTKPETVQAREIWAAQLAAADLVFLSKLDISEEPIRDKILSLVTKITGESKHLETQNIEQIVNAILNMETNPSELSISRIRPIEPKSDDLLQAQSTKNRDQISSFSLCYDQQISWTKFGLWLSMLLNRHGNKILRVKGIISIDSNQNPIIINGVQHIVTDPVELTLFPDKFIGMRLVFITDGISKSAVANSLERMLELPCASL